MSKRVRLRVPLPPSVNHIYRIVRAGGKLRLALTPEARRWKNSVALAIAANRDYFPFDVGEGSHFALRVWYYFPDRRRRDTHNCLKLLCDAVASGLGVDDRWILVREEGVEVDPDRPRLEIEVERVVK